MFYEFLPNFFILSLSKYRVIEWKDFPQIQRSANHKILVNLTGDSSLKISDSEVFKSNIQIFNCNHEHQFKYLINEYITNNKVLIVIFYKKTFLKNFLYFFIKHFANGQQYINDIDELIRINTGSLFTSSEVSSSC